MALLYARICYGIWAILSGVLMIWKHFMWNLHDIFALESFDRKSGPFVKVIKWKQTYKMHTPHKMQIDENFVKNMLKVLMCNFSNPG